MAAINYDAIAQELKRGLQDVEQHVACTIGTVDKPMALKEFYTLGIGGPRQTGKTKWMLENLIRDPASRLIVLNLTLRETVVNDLKAFNSLNDDNCILRPSGWLKIPDDVAEMIRQDPDLIDMTQSRILTSRNLADLVNQPDTLPIELTQIFIDNRVQTFNSMRYSKYYTWLAKKSNNYVLTWLID